MGDGRDMTLINARKVISQVATRSTLTIDSRRNLVYVVCKLSSLSI